MQIQVSISFHFLSAQCEFPVLFLLSPSAVVFPNLNCTCWSVCNWVLGCGPLQSSGVVFVWISLLSKLWPVNSSYLVFSRFAAVFSTEEAHQPLPRIPFLSHYLETFCMQWAGQLYVSACLFPISQGSLSLADCCSVTWMWFLPCSLPNILIVSGEQIYLSLVTLSWFEAEIQSYITLTTLI